MRAQAVFFDLDDTLVAFGAVGEESWSQVCAAYIARNPAAAGLPIQEAISAKSRWFWSDARRHRAGRQDMAAARRSFVVSAFRELGLPEGDAIEVADHFSRVRLENMYLFPGVHELLIALSGRGVKLALLTNGDSGLQRYKVERFDLERHFPHILIEGELGFGKPDRRMYTHALSVLGVEPDQAVMVGDNLEWDVGGPQAVGVRGIWVDWKASGLPPDARIVPDAVIRAVPELSALLE
jgi:putative hydrolase of the HAD superfamily